MFNTSTTITYRNPLENAVSKIFALFHVLWESGRFNSPDETTQAVLILLSLFKDGIIRTDAVYSDESLDSLKKTLDSLTNGETGRSQYKEILPLFSEQLSKLDKHTYYRFCHALGQIDIGFLRDNFAVVFDEVLYRTAESYGQNSGLSILPVELTRFMIRLSNLSKHARVYNPFAGLASFGVHLNEGQSYLGQELHMKSWALGSLRLLAHDRFGSAEYIHADSISHWPKYAEKYDLIITAPPFGLRLDKERAELNSWDYTTFEQFLLLNAVKSLNEKGVFIGFLPLGFLSSEGPNKELRKKLMNEDLIDMIVSIPGGLLYNTSIPGAIVVINKSKQRPGKTRFVLADTFVVKGEGKSKCLDDAALIRLIQGNGVNEDALRSVDNAQLQASDYNLSVARYFQQAIQADKNERLVKLKDILHEVRSQRGNLPETGKLVRVRDLKEDKVDFSLNVSAIENVALRRGGIRQINKKCLLLATRWRSLKPTIFVFEDTPVYVPQDVLAFKVDESVVEYGYVINELHADYVLEQLEAYRIGSAVPYLRKDDLLEVVVKLPSLSEQKAKVKGIFELSRKLRILQEENNSLALGVSSKLFESVSTIKHSLGKPLLNIGSSLRNIESALSRLSPEWQKTRLNERYDLTIKDTIDSIFGNLELIHSIIDKNESVLDVSNYELDEMEFLEFIGRYVNNVKAAEKKNVTTNLSINPDFQSRFNNKAFIRGDAKLLEVGLNAIVENANRHAFTDTSRKYKLEFVVSVVDAPVLKSQAADLNSKRNTYIKVEVANNGISFPANYTLEKLIRKNSFAGETGNTGQGGFDLNEIIKYHNHGVSTLELITDDFTTEFTTKYSFLIPLNA